MVTTDICKQSIGLLGGSSQRYDLGVDCDLDS